VPVDRVWRFCEDDLLMMLVRRFGRSKALSVTNLLVQENYIGPETVRFCTLMFLVFFLVFRREFAYF
jgi:hypothetical protein